jgi:hypothetical protein
LADMVGKRIEGAGAAQRIGQRFGKGRIEGHPRKEMGAPG